MSEVPQWLQVLQASATPAIAVAVAAIAFLQWRTANNKLVMDVFDRRLEVLRQVDHAIFDWMSEDGDKAYFDAFEKVERAELAAEFLFQPEISAYIRQIRSRLAEARRTDRQLSASDLPEDQAETLSARRIEIYDALNDDRRNLAQLCVPYMRIGQTRVRTFGEWFHDRNELRKSYGD